MIAKAILALALVAVSLAAPRQPGAYEEPAKYDFNYTVMDDYSGNDFGHQESRDGYNTQGSYYVLLPDGRQQRVAYTVDGDSGFVAEVTYEDSVSPPSGNCACGITNHFVPRLIGGSEVSKPQKYPWLVGLQQPGYYVGCGGSIINSRYILTAAHCFYFRCYYDPPSLLNSLIGFHSQFNTGELEMTYNISMKRHIIHPDYNCENNDNDFALIELSEDIILNDVIKPVCLPEDDNKTYESEIATAAGWGVKDDGDFSPVPLEVDLPILNTTCGGYTAFPTTVNMLCAGYPEGGKDTCQGDSGGPLIVQEDGKYVQVGVVSFGYGCALPGHPGVYARVSKVLDWIKSESADGQSCTY